MGIRWDLHMLDPNGTFFAKPIIPVMSSKHMQYTSLKKMFWLQVQEFIRYSCNVFQHSLFLVSNPFSRWRCASYHPERTLVVPPASLISQGIATDILRGLEKRNLFVVYRATCFQKAMNESFTYADVVAKKVRAFSFCIL
jgi:hypothetical protein